MASKSKSDAEEAPPVVEQDAPPESAPEIVWLKAFGTYPMPAPVKRGTVFPRPHAEALGYIERKWAGQVDAPVPPEAK